MNEGKIYIAANTRWASTRIDIDEILYIERRLRKIRVVTEDRVIEYYDRMAFITPLLGENFYSVLRGFFVNLERIEEVKEGKVIFDCKIEVAIPVKVYPSLKRTHNAHYRTMQLDSLEAVKKTLP